MTSQPSIDTLMPPEDFARFLGVSLKWLRPRLATMPGVIQESREVIRIWPRAYMEARTKGKAR